MTAALLWPFAYALVGAWIGSLGNSSMPVTTLWGISYGCAGAAMTALLARLML